MQNGDLDRAYLVATQNAKPSQKEFRRNGLNPLHKKRTRCQHCDPRKAVAWGITPNSTRSASVKGMLITNAGRTYQSMQSSPRESLSNIAYLTAPAV